MMLIFGGFGNPRGVVYALDLTTMKWSCLNNVKYDRWRHTANRIGNTISREWVAIPNAEPNGSLPQCRYSTSMFSFESKLYIFGGCNPA